MTRGHVDKPRCPFCYEIFDDIPSIMKHCAIQHRENFANEKESEKISTIRKRPCRYFRNGEGKCLPPPGSCEYNHIIVPESERELCFHKQACKFKPNCIFLHPEGQQKGEWQINTNKVAKMCHYSQQGKPCLRFVCNFYHSPSGQNLDFHWDQRIEPPLVDLTGRTTSTMNFKKVPNRI